MTILKYIGNGQKRSCDSACHNATVEKCECVCGGRYHGAGSSKKALAMIVEDFVKAKALAPPAMQRQIETAITLLGTGMALPVNRLLGS